MHRLGTHESARHLSLKDQCANLEELKIKRLKAKLADAKGKDTVFGEKEDELLREVVNYGIHSRTEQNEQKTAVKQASGTKWNRLKKESSRIHVTHVLHMVEDLVPFGLSVKHAYILIRFSDGTIYRCDLMPKQKAAHSELRSFIPGVEVEGKVRYNLWINDDRAGESYVIDLYTFVTHFPSLLKVELLRQKLQEKEYSTFNLEAHNCQDFTHDVILLLAKTEEKDNVRFNTPILNCLQKYHCICCKCR